jgi:hypothetical protein
MRYEVTTVVTSGMFMRNRTVTIIEAENAAEACKSRVDAFSAEWKFSAHDQFTVWAEPTLKEKI